MDSRKIIFVSAICVGSAALVPLVFLIITYSELQPLLIVISNIITTFICVSSFYLISRRHTEILIHKTKYLIGSTQALTRMTADNRDLLNKAVLQQDDFATQLQDSTNSTSTTLDSLLTLLQTIGDKADSKHDATDDFLRNEILSTVLNLSHESDIQTALCKDTNAKVAFTTPRINEIYWGSPTLSLRKNLLADITAYIECQKLLGPSMSAYSFPPVNSWALTPQVLKKILDLCLTLDPGSNIVEFGSGVSTVWIAALKKTLSLPFTIQSFEHNQQFYSQLSKTLISLDLTNQVDLRLAPLTQRDIEGNSYEWYNITADNLIDNIGLAIVDGPPGTTGVGARYPAVPAIWNNRANKLHIVLDDYIREDEKSIVEEWCKKYGLQKHETVDSRAMVLLGKGTDT